MLLRLCEKLNGLNEFLFRGLDGMIENFPVPDWVADALIDSIHTLPFLFIVFLFIEIFEYFWADKLNHFMSKSGKSGPIIGSISAIIPQCGFSIIASTLYTNKLITRGTIIAIYLATSDEALPILLSYPNKLNLVLPLIFAKFLVAITAGYLVDLIFKIKLNDKHIDIDELHEDEGCCKHDILTKNKINLWLHPLAHTFNVGLFILGITLILNFFISDSSIINLLTSTSLKAKIFEPVIAAIIGLIPNCAVSVAITVMLIKGTISFGSAIAGLCSNAGLGLLVLLRKNDKFSDSLLVIGLLLISSIISGLIFQFANFG